MGRKTDWMLFDLKFDAMGGMIAKQRSNRPTPEVIVAEDELALALSPSERLKRLEKRVAELEAARIDHEDQIETLMNLIEKMAYALMRDERIRYMDDFDPPRKERPRW